MSKIESVEEAVIRNLALAAAILVVVAMKQSFSPMSSTQWTSRTAAKDQSLMSQRNVIEHDYSLAATGRNFIPDSAPVSHKCLFVRVQHYTGKSS